METKKEVRSRHTSVPKQCKGFPYAGYMYRNLPLGTFAAVVLPISLLCSH
jgi:hypothetical protein